MKLVEVNQSMYRDPGKLADYLLDVMKEYSTFKNHLRLNISKDDKSPNIADITGINFNKGVMFNTHIIKVLSSMFGRPVKYVFTDNPDSTYLIGWRVGPHFIIPINHGHNTGELMIYSVKIMSDTFMGGSWHEVT